MPVKRQSTAPDATDPITDPRARPAAPAMPVKAVSDRQQVYEAMDRLAHARVAKATSGLSPSALGEAWMDWAVHLAVSPGKQLHLMEQALQGTQALMATAIGKGPSDPELDKRFSGEAWQKFPFNVWSQAQMATWQWWQDAMTGVHGVTPEHDNLMAFTAGLAIDAASPVELGPDQSRGDRGDAGRAGPEPAPRREEPRRRHRPPRRTARKQSPGALRGRAQSCDHPRQGRVPQRSDRIDPICAARPARCARSRS